MFILNPVLYPSEGAHGRVVSIQTVAASAAFAVGRKRRASDGKSKFLVRTDGPDGGSREYEIAYTFGVSPLQQYLIAFPDGRYQALGIAWGSRPKDPGSTLIGNQQS